MRTARRRETETIKILKRALKDTALILFMAAIFIGATILFMEYVVNNILVAVAVVFFGLISFVQLIAYKWWDSLGD